MNKHITTYIAGSCLFVASLLGSCKKDSEFTHEAGSPMKISAFTPESGGGTTQVLITGNNFAANPSDIIVTINGKVVPVVGVNGNQIMVVVPKKCGSGKIKVKIGTDSTESSTDFTYFFTRTVSTLAGSGVAGFANGQGVEAQFNFSGQNWYRSGGLAVDDDLNVYVADVGNACIRKIDSTGNVTTFCGSPGNSGYAEGAGTAARFALPYSIAIDKDRNLYVTDPANWDIRKITPTGNSTSYLWSPAAPWAVDINKNTGNLYWSCTDAGTVYEANAPFTSTSIASGLSYPAGIAVDGNGNVYVSCNGENTVRKLAAGSWANTLIAGVPGSAGYVDGPGSTAKFSTPWFMACDLQNNILVAGNGTWNGDPGSPDQSIRLIQQGSWAVSTFAGSGTAGYIDAIGSAAAFGAPTGVAVDKNGTVYVFDKNNNRVRKIVSE